MRGLGSQVLIGNHGLACLGQLSTADFNDAARIANDWNGGQLQPASRAFVQAGAPTLTTAHGALLTHASPRDPIWEYVDQVAIATANFDAVTTQVCSVGHTHVPVAFERSADGQVVGTYLEHGAEVHLRGHTVYPEPGQCWPATGRRSAGRLRGVGHQRGHGAVCAHRV